MYAQMNIVFDRTSLVPSWFCLPAISVFFVKWIHTHSFPCSRSYPWRLSTFT